MLRRRRAAAAPRAVLHDRSVPAVRARRRGSAASSTTRAPFGPASTRSTHLPGLYVAGDASRAVQWVVVAAAEGAEAAFAINTDLIKEDLQLADPTGRFAIGLPCNAIGLVLPRFVPQIGPQFDVLLRANQSLDVASWPAAGPDSTRPGGTMFQQIERQFVRTARPLYGHLVNLLEAAIARGELPSGSRAAAGTRARAAAADQPHDRRQRVPRARVARAAARLRRTRHVRLRRARAERDAVRVARQDCVGGAALERLDAARRDPPFVRRAAAVARRGRAGDRLLSRRRRFSRRSITC